MSTKFEAIKFYIDSPQLFQTSYDRRNESKVKNGDITLPPQLTKFIKDAKSFLHIS